MRDDYGPFVVALIFTVLCLFGLIAFVAFKMGDLNNRIKALEEMSMSENRLTTLRCGTGYQMARLYEQPPHDPGLSVWVCIDCGSLAVHVEGTGDIFWYGAQAKSHTTDEPGAPRVSLMGPVFPGPPETTGTGHRAGCAYCPTRFDCSCDSPGQRHMCPRCDAEAEDSKMTGELPTEEVRIVDRRGLAW